MNKIKKTAQFLINEFGEIPSVAVILGSGFNKVTESFTDVKSLHYDEIDGFPISTVPGHKGELVVGRLNGVKVMAFCGRFHYYEGYSMQEIAFPIRVVAAAGVETLVLTNASGGINESFEAGDLAIITDHIKFFDESPLRGENYDAIGPRFPDMTYAYDVSLAAIAKNEAMKLEIPLKKGVYAFMPGPSFETPAEIRALRVMGADMVGMSTVPECITAVHAGLKVLGISCVCNMAAGILDKPLSHEEVIAAGNAASDNAVKLLSAIVEKIA